MRTLEAARQSWEELKGYSTLRDLKNAVRIEVRSSVATSGCRSACWKAFLLFDSIDTSTWLKTLASSRSAYNSLRAHFLKYLENPDDLAANYDPLSDDSESALSSPWTQLRKDEELRAEIKLDVDRCMPETPYFRQPDAQRILLDVLFIFCRLNPDVSYRQGMHEILAPILWVVEHDAIDLGQSSKALGEDATIRAVFDSDHIEHDAFALFGQVMQSAKNFYEHTTHSGTENPIVSRSRKIFNELIPLVDEKLAKHLESVEIVPQVFLIRWIRLLFGREFAFDDMLAIWDVMFAEDSSLQIVDYICVAMLLRMRWQLIAADYNTALTLLLQYPAPNARPGDLSPQSLALDALYIRDHMDRHGGSYLVAKYTGRPLLLAGRPVTPPAMQRNITTFSGSNVVKSASPSSRLSPPATNNRQTRNIEAVLQSTAKTIYARSEKLGIGKAVRSAVDEVHKKAEEIRNTPTPSPPVNWRQRNHRGSIGSATSFARVRVLEERSKELATSLEGAVSELWEYQKQAAESAERQGAEGAETTGIEKSWIERLSVAIARVQFVQVYLGDPNLPLPEEERPEEQHDEQSNNVRLHDPLASSEVETNESIFDALAPEEKGKVNAQHIPVEGPRSPEHVDGLADPSTFDEFVEAAPDVDKSTASQAAPGSAKKSSPTLRQSDTDQASASRPPLEQSSFSWMLGQQQDPSTRPFGNAALLPEQTRNKAFLFGDEEAEGEKEVRTRSRDRRGSRKQQKRPSDAQKQAEDTGFSLGSLRHGKGTNE